MNSQSGFTLTELLAVIAIASILAALAAPSFRDMVRDNRVTAATNTFIAHLALARSEAITRRTTVALCRSADPRRQQSNLRGWPYRLVHRVAAVCKLQRRLSPHLRWRAPRRARHPH